MNKDKEQRIYDEGRRDGFYAGVRAERTLAASQILRCKDCKWCMAYSKATYCDRFAHELPTVELDGFCAWGERK